MAETVELSAAQQDYLKQIYLLGERRPDAVVSTMALARRLAVRPPSVSGMLRKLAERQLVEHVPYRGVRLSERGRRAALRLLRLHRLLESFLHDVLGYGWEEVHEEAERLEHVISDLFCDRIAAALGHPTHDPHGDPIPTAELSLPPSTGERPLHEVETPRRVRIVRVRAQDVDTLNLLARLDLVPGVEIEAIESGPAGVRVAAPGGRLLLPLEIGRELLVTEAAGTRGRAASGGRG